MIPDRRVGVHLGALDRPERDLRRQVRRSPHEVTSAPEARQRTAILNDDRLELAIIHPRVWREADAVAIFAAVRERNQQRR